jgi:hypothetical protein
LNDFTTIITSPKTISKPPSLTINESSSIIDDNKNTPLTPTSQQMAAKLGLKIKAPIPSNAPNIDSNETTITTTPTTTVVNEELPTTKNKRPFEQLNNEIEIQSVNNNKQPVISSKQPNSEQQIVKKPKIEESKNSKPTSELKTPNIVNKKQPTSILKSSTPAAATTTTTPIKTEKKSVNQPAVEIKSESGEVNKTVKLEKKEIVKKQTNNDVKLQQKKVQNPPIKSSSLSENEKNDRNHLKRIKK